MEAQYHELAKRIGLENSERIPKLFKMVADLDEADLLLAMPADVKELSEKLGRPEEEVAESIKAVYDAREETKGLKMVYEPKYLRFFQARFEPLA